MPDSDELRESGTTEPTEGPEKPAVPDQPAAAPPPTPPQAAIASEDVKGLREAVSGLTDMVATLRQGYEMLARGGAQQAPILPADVDDAAIDEAIAEGKAAPLVRKMVEARVARAVQEHIVPLRDQVQGTGMRAIADLAIEAVRPQLKYYDRYKKEIDTALAQVDPQFRMNPATIRAAHDIVVGQHISDLTNEEVEKAVRSARENPTGTPAPAAGRKQPVGVTVPTAGELWGKETADAVAGKGGEDSFARSFGYENWAEYLKKTNVGGEA